MIKSESETRRVRMTKRLLKDALMELMTQKPLSSISVTDLCNIADVNRSTFYSYYSDTLQLLGEIENDLINQLPAAKPIDGHPDLNGTLVEEFTLFFTYVRKHARDFDVLLQTGRIEFSERIMRTVMDRFPQQQGKNQNKIITRWGYLYAMNGVIGILRDWIREDFPVPDCVFAKLALEMCFRANDFPERTAL